MTSKPPPVLRAVHVKRTPDEAFRVFTDEIGQWWPLATHSPSEKPVDVTFIDGRIVETDADGGTSDWGEVTAWEPPHRLAFTWHVGMTPEQTPTQVEVSFRADDDGTRVELAHSGWEAYGDAAEQVRSSYDSPDGWTGVLDKYAKQASVSATTPSS